MTRGEWDHNRDLKVRAIKVALSLTDLSPSDAKALLPLIAEVLDFMSSPEKAAKLFAVGERPGL